MRVCTNVLHHDGNKKTFTGEVSDFGPDFHYEQNDRGEFGLTLVSDLGTTADFVIVKYEIDDEGEIQAWVLAPTAESVERNPRLQYYTLTVFND